MLRAVQREWPGEASLRRWSEGGLTLNPTWRRRGREPWRFWGEHSKEEEEQGQMPKAGRAWQDPFNIRQDSLNWNYQKVNSTQIKQKRFTGGRRGWFIESEDEMQESSELYLGKLQGRGRPSFLGMLPLSSPIWTLAVSSHGSSSLHKGHMTWELSAAVIFFQPFSQAV